MPEEIKAKLPDRIRENNLNIIVCPAEKMPEDLVEQLVEKSKQSHVASLDSTGGSRRFKDVKTYKNWAAGKKRTIYLLIDKTGDNRSEIAGIVWFGEKKHESLDDKYEVTFGVRLYKDYLGKGLSKPFIRATQSDVGRFYGGKFIWLETDDDNIPAIKAYEALGYRTAAHIENRLIMTYPDKLENVGGYQE